MDSIFDIKFAAKSDEETDKLGYYLLLEKWTETEFAYKVVFDDPLSISKGQEPDNILLDVKNPGLFISAASGEKVDPVQANA